MYTYEIAADARARVDGLPVEALVYRDRRVVVVDVTRVG
ncbi:hypothetical protein ABIA39_006184 [Nocardia sp. GAS34]